MKLTLEEGIKRGFHSTYDVLAQGEWRWTGDGWELSDGGTRGIRAEPMADQKATTAASAVDIAAALRHLGYHGPNGAG